MLAAHGAKKISAYVTHGIFPNRSWERFQHDNGGRNPFEMDNYDLDRSFYLPSQLFQNSQLPLVKVFWFSFTVGPSEGLSFFWITDSCPLTVMEVKNKRPFEILSLASSIAVALQI